jgi:hypothetical protein
MLAVNGDDMGDGGDGVAPLSASDGFHVIVGDEWGFATSRCDGCHSRLGGDRFVGSFLPVGNV